MVKRGGRSNHLNDKSYKASMRESAISNTPADTPISVGNDIPELGIGGISVVGVGLDELEAL